MALHPGTKLGPYEIQSPLGAGGMGEVYRARDTRLDRTVAVKILPPHLSDNQEARQRFEREARAISSLNHPNICTLHDIGSQDGTAYLVMEYVQGETLDTRLLKGPLPLKQALETGIQICDALEKAHRAGIVHRDLKPGNIMLTPTGAKLLDFGLAKPAAAMLGSQTLTNPPGSKGNLTPSTPTVNLSMLSATPAQLTQQGTIVGTFQYMAPEVVQGGDADARSDVFSLGCVLCEMITGRRVFDGKTQLSVLTAILEKDPEPVSKLQPMTPPALDHVVGDCLVKDPDARWQNAADVGRQLRWIAGGASAPAVVEQKTNTGGERLVWAGLVLALLAGLGWFVMRGQSPVRTIRSYLLAPPGYSYDFTGDFSGPPVISPDGLAVVFSARGAKESNALWVQNLNDLTAKKLEGTEGASFPFWSPDSKNIGFFSAAQMKRVPATGGPITMIADAPNARGGAWGPDNVILYEPDYRETIWKVNANGGPGVRLTKMDAAKHTTHRWPMFLPDGKHFLFFATNHSGSSEHGVYFGSLADGTYHHVVGSDSGAQYASGYLFYHLQTQLLAQKFDAVKGVISGDPTTLVNFVGYDAGTWHTTFSTNESGLLLYEPGTGTSGSNLLWFDATGKSLGPVAERAAYRGAGRISPDGKRLAIAAGDPQADIWVYDLARGSHTRLTFGGANHLTPTWSPDGQRVIYIKQMGSTVMEGTSICAHLANGSGQEEVLLDHIGARDQTLLSPQFSPDGRYLLHLEQSGPNGAAVWAVPSFGDKKPIPIIRPPSAQSRIVQYRLSPDGRWLAYSSTETGREEVYVTQFPSGSGKWQVSQVGGTFPTWRADSRVIYYGGFDRTTLYSAAVRPNGNELEVEPAQPLFPISFVAPIGNSFEVSPDGKRFIITALPENAAAPLVLVSNWMTELKK